LIEDLNCNGAGSTERRIADEDIIETIERRLQKILPSNVRMLGVYVESHKIMDPMFPQNFDEYPGAGSRFDPLVIRTYLIYHEGEA
jgi:hypothetical protein